MSSIVDAVAGGIARMDAAQLVQLLERVAPGLEVRLIGTTEHNPDTHALVPRVLTAAMIQAARYDHWSQANAPERIQETWRKLLAKAEQEGA